MEDLNLICPSNNSKKAECGSGNSARVTAQLASELDYLHNKYSPRIIVLATTSEIESVDPTLRRIGRFAKEITISILNEDSRTKLFASQFKDAFLAERFKYSLSEKLFDQIGKQTQGFVVADIALLIRKIEQCSLRNHTRNIKEIVEETLKEVKKKRFYICILYRAHLTLLFFTIVFFISK